MASKMSLLSSLADRIKIHASIVEEQLKKHGNQHPSFDRDGLERYPNVPKLQMARFQLLEAAMDMYILASGPGEYLTWHTMNLKNDYLVLRILNDFSIWDAVPLHGSATHSSIASNTGIPVSFLKRLLRFAMTMHLFSPSPPSDPDSDAVQHTAMSAYPVRNPKARDWLAHMLEESAPAAVKVPSWLKRIGDTQEPGRCPIMEHLHPGCPNEESLFDFYSIDDGTLGPTAVKDVKRAKGWRMERFGNAMVHFSSLGPSESEHLLNAFDWHSLGDGVVVDIGGGTGHDSMALAKKHPRLRAVVQDFPGMKESFDALCPAEIKDRVSFVPHNFRTEEQPIKGADVYMLKSILHDYSDKYAIDIVARVRRAMKPNSKIVMIDQIISPYGAIPWYMEKVQEGLDLHLWLTLSARARSRGDWVQVFRSADEKFQLKTVVHPPECLNSVMEFV